MKIQEKSHKTVDTHGEFELLSVDEVPSWSQILIEEQTVFYIRNRTDNSILCLTQVLEEQDYGIEEAVFTSSGQLIISGSEPEGYEGQGLISVYGEVLLSPKHEIDETEIPGLFEVFFKNSTDELNEDGDIFYGKGLLNKYGEWVVKPMNVDEIEIFESEFLIVSYIGREKADLITFRGNRFLTIDAEYYSKYETISLLQLLMPRNIIMNDDSYPIYLSYPLNGKIGLYDYRNEQELLPPKFSSFNSEINEIILLEYDDVWYSYSLSENKWITKCTEPTIYFSFLNIGPAHKSTLIVETDTGWGLFNFERRNFEIKPVSQQIYKTDNGMFFVLKDGTLINFTSKPKELIKHVKYGYVGNGHYVFCSDYEHLSIDIGSGTQELKRVTTLDPFKDVVETSSSL